MANKYGNETNKLMNSVAIFLQDKTFEDFMALLIVFFYKSERLR